MDPYNSDLVGDLDSDLDSEFYSGLVSGGYESFLGGLNIDDDVVDEVEVDDVEDVVDVEDTKEESPTKSLNRNIIKKKSIRANVVEYDTNSDEDIDKDLDEDLDEDIDDDSANVEDAEDIEIIYEDDPRPKKRKDLPSKKDSVINKINVKSIVEDPDIDLSDEEPYVDMGDNCNLDNTNPSISPRADNLRNDDSVMNLDDLEFKMSDDNRKENLSDHSENIITAGSGKDDVFGMPAFLSDTSSDVEDEVTTGAGKDDVFGMPTHLSDTTSDVEDDGLDLEATVDNDDIVFGNALQAYQF